MLFSHSSAAASAACVTNGACVLAFEAPAPVHAHGAPRAHRRRAARRRGAPGGACAAARRRAASAEAAPAASQPPRRPPAAAWRTARGAPPPAASPRAAPPASRPPAERQARAGVHSQTARLRSMQRWLPNATPTSARAWCSAPPPAWNHVSSARSAALGKASAPASPAGSPQAHAAKHSASASAVAAARITPCVLCVRGSASACAARRGACQAVVPTMLD
jgi:hypothetical protein